MHWCEEPEMGLSQSERLFSDPNRGVEKKTLTKSPVGGTECWWGASRALAKKGKKNSVRMEAFSFAHGLVTPTADRFCFSFGWSLKKLVLSGGV